MRFFFTVCLILAIAVSLVAAHQDHKDKDEHKRDLQSDDAVMDKRRSFFPKLQEPKGGSGSKNGPGTSGQGLFSFKKRRLDHESKDKKMSARQTVSYGAKKADAKPDNDGVVPVAY